uniref:DNA topoisomerase (ATP-hydrolyzing) n=1 Tax=Angiostrongylus cantonensis TaxID=6313 RepID=A0A0K0DNP6_ANGCA
MTSYLILLAYMSESSIEDSDVSVQAFPFTRLIFPLADDHILNYLEEENQLIEPEWCQRFPVLRYCPIIPMILVNGAEGIATGWYTRVLTHDIRNVMDNVRRLIDGCDVEKMVPCFSDFSGTVKEIDENRFEIRGKFKFLPLRRKNAPFITLEITELPVGEWTNRYKQNVLQPLHSRGVINFSNDSCEGDPWVFGRINATGFTRQVHFEQHLVAMLIPFETKGRNE